MTQPPSVAGQVAAWAHGLRLDDVPPELLVRVKLHVLDQIGAEVASCRRPVVANVRRYLDACARPGPCTVVGTARRADAEAAAFVNATAGHSMEIDDYAQGAFAHPGCVVVPAVLAVAEEVGASGAAATAAILAGFEHTVRLGLASMPSMLLDRGFHQTCAHGVFAAALTTSVLLELDQPTTVNALAVAGSHASGTTEYAHAGGEVKRVHAGLGAMGGIRAARLARAGVTGPATIYEGPRGFLQAFAARYDAAKLYDNLSQRWYFGERGAIKPYACVGSIHACLAALDDITAIHPVEATEVERVVLGADVLTQRHAGSIGPEPTDMVGAQFSAHFALALRIVKGANDLDAYIEAERAGFADPGVIALAKRVVIEEDAECNERWPSDWLGRVTLHLTGGQVLTALAQAPGTPRHPLSKEQIIDKFTALARREMAADQAYEIVSLVMNLEQLDNITTLSRLLSGEAQ
jgi:2-methylcitrate dehydratase PrpD